MQTLAKKSAPVARAPATKNFCDKMSSSIQTQRADHIKSRPKNSPHQRGIGTETPLEKTALYREQAGYCADMLLRTADPERRAQIEREHLDWLALAKQLRSWASPPNARDDDNLSVSDGAARAS